jgi:hypothetical protein
LRILAKSVVVQFQKFDSIFLRALRGFPSRSSRLRAFDRKARKGFAKGAKKIAEATQTAPLPKSNN